MTQSMRLGRLVTKDRVSGETQAHGEHGHFASGGGGGAPREIEDVRRLEINARDAVSARGLAANPLIDSMWDGGDREEKAIKAGLTADLADRMLTPTEDLVALVRPVMDKECPQLTFEQRPGQSSSSLNSFVTRTEDPDPNTATHVLMTGNGRLVFARIDEQSVPDAVERFEQMSRDLYTGAEVIPIDDPQVDGMLRQYAVSSLISQWAQTSNDSSADALAVQSAAEDVLGVHGAAGWSNPPAGDGHPPPRLDLTLGGDTASSGEPILREFVQCQYDATQELFKAAGYGPDDTIRLFRGEGSRQETSVTTPGPPDGTIIPIPRGLEKYAGQYVDATLRPLSSWSSDLRTSLDPYFTGGGRSALTTLIPVRDVVSMYCTGVGCANESEFVIKGGPKTDLYVTTPKDARGTTFTPPKQTVAIGRLRKYSPDQARDDHGRFSSGSGTASSTTDEHGARVDAKAAEFVAAGGRVEYHELWKMDPKDQRALARSLRSQLKKQGDDVVTGRGDAANRREMGLRMMSRALDFTENKQELMGGRARNIEMLPHLFVMRDGEGKIAGLAAWSVGGALVGELYIYMDYVGSSGRTPGVGSAALAELIPSAAKAGVEICGEPLKGAISFWKDSGAEYKPAGPGTREWVDFSVDKVKAMNDALSTDLPYENLTKESPKFKETVFKSSRTHHEFNFTGTGVPVEYDDLPHTGSFVGPDDPDAVIEEHVTKSAEQVAEIAAVHVPKPSKKTVLGTLRKDRVSGAEQAHGAHGYFTSGSGESLAIPPIHQGESISEAGNPLASISAVATMEDPILKTMPDDVREKVEGNFVKGLGVTTEVATANVIAMYEKASPETRAAGERWYQEAHDFSAHVAQENGIDPHVMAAMVAATSPGQLWDANKRLAEATAQAISNPDRVITQEEADKFNAKNPKIIGDFRIEAGQTVGSVFETGSTKVAGVLVATMSGISAGKSYDGIGKAVQLGMANDPSKISEILGGAKVRSFFNNIDEPTNPRDVTIDIHMLRALSNGDHTEGGHDRMRYINAKDGKAMSMLIGTPSYQGASIGAYPVAADVVRNATAMINEAHGTNLVPSQVQAIVWGQQLEDYSPGTMVKVNQGKI